MKTTIEIDSELLSYIKLYCNKKGVYQKDFFLDIINGKIDIKDFRKYINNLKKC